MYLKNVITLFVLSFSGWAQNIGDRCGPGAVGRPGLTCQVTGEWEYDGPYVLNAQKGDVINSVGAGTIGSLLMQMDPPQYSDHCGIIASDIPMTVCNASCSEKWLVDRDYFDTASLAGTDVPLGINPESLQHCWPGMFTLSVQEAFEGLWLINPDRQKPYQLNVLGTDPLLTKTDHSVKYPDVIKPAWKKEFNHPSVRPALYLIADKAQALGAHYRWFAYSKADIWNKPDYASCPSPWCGSDHAAAMCCSSLIWAAAQAANVPVESAFADPTQLEDKLDKPHAPGQPGLYIYSEKERQAAGASLFANVFTKGLQENSDYKWYLLGFDEYVAHLAITRIANQMCNALASDDCSHPSDLFASGSDAWQKPGRGVAVSPDDIKNWNGPPGGVYGYNEPLVYVPAPYQRVRRWAASAGTGTIMATVHLGTSEVPNVPVYLGFAGLHETTDSSGVASFGAIPAGSYPISASLALGGTTLVADQVVQVPADGLVSVDLKLVPPNPPTPPAFLTRKVSISGSMFINDGDCLGDDSGTFPLSHQPIILDPLNHNKEHFDFGKNVDEVIGGLYGDLELTIVNREPVVTCIAHMRLCEDDCSGDNVKKTIDLVMNNIRPGWWSSLSGAGIIHSWFCGNDKVVVNFTVSNDQGP